MPTKRARRSLPALIAAGWVALERQLDRAPATAPGDNADPSGLVAQASDGLDQPDHDDAVGQKGDALGIGFLPGVQGGQVEVGQGDVFDGGGIDGAGLNGEGGDVGHGEVPLGATVILDWGRPAPRGGVGRGCRAMTSPRQPITT